MYKDKDKQREANRERQRRYKARHKGVTSEGVTEPKRSFIGAVPVTLDTMVVKPKRGKDIKCFEDLPVDVQETIHRLSTINGKIDKVDKDKRTARAVHYQHLFPGRYYSTGVA